MVFEREQIDLQFGPCLPLWIFLSSPFVSLCFHLRRSFGGSDGLCPSFGGRALSPSFGGCVRLSGPCFSLSPFVSFDLSTSFGGGVPLNDQFLISVVTFGSVQFGRGRGS